MTKRKEQNRNSEEKYRELSCLKQNYSELISKHRKGSFKPSIMEIDEC